MLVSGEITGECTGPQGSTVPVSIQQDMPETAQIIVTPKAPGPHTLSLLYAGFPLPFSPINALAEASNGGVRLILTGKGLASAICNQIAEFNIDGSQANPGRAIGPGIYEQFWLLKSDMVSPIQFPLMY